MHKLTLAIWLLLGCLPIGATFAETTNAPRYHFSSDKQQVALLELYTSEGCSSCPPAEAWFGKLLQHPDLWQRIVPVVYHVDYWNDLGWTDPFSTPQHSARQRQHQREGGVNAVYTPGFVLNGREWRGWFAGEQLPDDTQTAGVLIMDVHDGRLSAEFGGGPTTSEPLELQVALLGFDLTTQVAAGENRGRALTHQFVVLEQVSKIAEGSTWSLEVPRGPNTQGKRALAVWVTHPNSLSPLQATGGWLQ